MTNETKAHDHAGNEDCTDGSCGTRVAAYAPAPRKPTQQRGAPYRCERCKETHRPQLEVMTPHAEQTPAQRAQDVAFYIYRAHKVYEVGTERAEAIRKLRAICKPGDTLGTIMRSVSRSGMMRHISVLHGTDDITWLVARAEGVTCCDDGGIKAGGCGMDMGFSVVYNLSSLLYPDGFTCTGKKTRCPSNDHANGDRSYRRHRHGSGGYALRQRWL